MLLFQIFLIRSMLWKILHLLVCFELRSCDFLVKSNFGPLTICLILVVQKYYVVLQYYLGNTTRVVCQRSLSFK